MRKITSFLMMAAMCCASAFAQEVGQAVDTQLPENKLVQIGTAQAEMVPGKWYFLQNPRNGQNDSYEYFAVPGEKPKRGGLVEDRGTGVGLSKQTDMDAATSDEGVSSETYKSRMVRFVEVEGVEGAYNIQFGTGRWFGDGDPVNTATINQNQYIGGLAGKWNFYLILNAEGQPNTAGRFAWNYYDKQNRVDNNGQGNSVNFWNSGELTLESLDWNQVDEQGDAGIIGNNVWQIYDIIVVGELDVYEEAFNAMIEDYTTITGYQEGAFIDNLLAGQNVGLKPGNYRQEDVNAFMEIHQVIDELMYTMETDGLEAVQAQYPTAKDLEELNQKYVDAYNHMINNRVPLAMSGIQPGYYTFNSSLYWYVTKNDTTFYTQEEAEEANAESGALEGEDGYVAAGDVKEVTSTQVPAPIRALCAESSTASDGTTGEWLAHIPLKPEAKFLWKIETVEGKPTEYRMINMLKGETFTGITQSTANGQLSKNDTATVCFDWRNDAEPVKYEDLEGNVITDTVVSFNIRSSSQPSDSYNYLHCNGHSSGAGGQNWIVGWADGGATRWYMSPIDEATAEEWINGPEAQLRKKIQKGDSIAAAFPAQLDVAKDLVADMDTTTNVANINTFSSPYHCPAEGNMEQLFDGTYNNANNFWHSNWQNGNDYAYSTTNGTNYFVVEDVDGLIDGGLAVMVARRPVANDHLTQLTVYGTNDAYSPEEDLANIKAGGEALYTWTELGVLKTPYGTGSEFIASNAIAFDGKYQYYKFVATGTTNNRGYFHMGEFALYPAKISKRYETTQYDVRKAEAEALAAAVAVWNEKGFAADSLELLEDETFDAAYETLVAAADAWGKVFVNPTALRDELSAAPAENLFVYGKNPGQWPETRSAGSTPAQYLAVLADANAYNAAGAYTPAESEAHIKALQEAIDGVFAAANKIETGKWYRFSFASEEMYENYGWDKTGAKASENAAGVVTSPALFGKTIAVGKGLVTYEAYENTEAARVDTASVRSIEATEEWYEGDNLCFFEDADFSEGEDLFRFIQATDTSYMIQNKATGLFVHAGHPVTLSAVPSYFSANQAIGAGANLITYTDVLGKTDGQHVYLHGERSTNYLTKWNASTIGSNSMMFIEEVEAVAEAPATAYDAKLWPGKVYTYTMPVDVTVTEGATAYGAELVVTEEDTTVVLKAIEAEVISAGSPFILIADPKGEYITTADRLKQIASDILAKEGKYGLNEKQQANTQLNDEYAIVSLNHGMEVDTVVTELLALRGTLESKTVEAGKAILAKENGFEHTLVNKSVGANTAWIVSDFDPESTEVLSGLVVEIEGSIDTGISEVLDKVAKSGNIYNAAGQLVGKGNINTVNSLPAGVYIVNGVKVTKK